MKKLVSYLSACFMLTSFSLNSLHATDDVAGLNINEQPCAPVQVLINTEAAAATDVPEAATTTDVSGAAATTTEATSVPTNGASSTTSPQSPSIEGAFKASLKTALSTAAMVMRELDRNFQQQNPIRGALAAPFSQFVIENLENFDPEPWAESTKEAAIFAGGAIVGRLKTTAVGAYKLIGSASDTASKTFKKVISSQKGPATHQATNVGDLGNTTNARASQRTAESPEAVLISQPGQSSQIQQQENNEHPITGTSITPNSNDGLEARLRDQLEDGIRAQMRAQLEAKMRAQLEAKIRAELKAEMNAELEARMKILEDKMQDALKRFGLIEQNETTTQESVSQTSNSPLQESDSSAQEQPKRGVLGRILGLLNR